jgi:ADP-dependent glucokinase
VAVSAAIGHIFHSKAAGTRLSRIHFHSLEFHIIAVMSDRQFSWSAEKATGAVAAGSLAASLQACNSELNSLTSELHFATDKVVNRWQQEGIQFALAAVLVCKKPLKTVGLGDIISATGLLYSW